MNIAIRIERAYGRELTYVCDRDQADAINALTGTRTLTPQHADALKRLGHTFTIESILGRKVSQ